MGAPSCEAWRLEQASARARLRRLRRIELAGFYVASVVAGFGLGVLVMVAAS